jgi:site-specific DNA-methyltransferase (adenine-specific)
MVDVISGDSLNKLQNQDENTFDSCVTDPPYELGFMGKRWDESGIAFNQDFWEEVYRVLKPGAHLLAFGGTRTHHRMMVAIEDAGFEIRDTLMWVYGGGFPKNHDVSKAIDKKKGKFDERKKVGERSRNVKPFDDSNGWNENSTTGYFEYTEAATEEAKKWEGWGTALKPAHEPIVLARKPLSGTVVETVLKHGTGAINIDSCRIENGERPKRVISKMREDYDYNGNSLEGRVDGSLKSSKSVGTTTKGRYPANLILDERASVMLDEQSGELYSASAVYGTEDGSESLFGSGENGRKTNGHDATGGASRFFYCPKANGDKDRHLGVEKNNHPTVKPIELMGYLVRLVTPKDGHVLDPFAGSGTTGIAAQLEGVSCTLIEKDEESVEISKKRNEYVKANLPEVKRDLYEDPSNKITEEQTEVNDHSFW